MAFRQAAAGQLVLSSWLDGNDIECIKFSFMYSGVELWNDKFSEIRNSANVQTFKFKYKKAYFTSSQ